MERLLCGWIPPCLVVAVGNLHLQRPAGNEATGMTFWARFALAVLAAWRVSHLLAQEDGPGGIVARLRSRLGNGVLGNLLDCFLCVSVWVALPLAFFVDRNFQLSS